MLTKPPTVVQASESATTALYRAALGPVNVDYYLDVFERFDEAGRASPVWNAAAGFLSINWMVFRQLWGPVLAYVAGVGGLVLLTLSLGRHFLQWPSAVEWGVLVALLLVSIAIPGAYGNAALHADARRRITHAVHSAKTVREACAVLQKQASSPQRRWGLVLLNAVVLAGCVMWNPLSSSWVLERGVTAAVTPAAEALSDTAVAAPVVQATVPLPVPEVAPAPAAEPVAVAPPEPLTPSPLPVAETPESTTTPNAMVQASNLPAIPQPQVHGINVGVFADKTNAERVRARLDAVGITAILQTVQSSKGELTRVRVGPFRSRAQADAVAARIRALDLDAVVFQP